MTATPDNRLRARIRRVARGSVAFAIVLAVCGGSATAFAADGGDAADTDAVELRVTVGVRGLVAAGSATSVSLSVQNDSATELSSGRVVVELSRSALPDASAVSTWLDDGEADGVFDELATDTTAAVKPESSGAISIPVGQASLADLTPGVYPVRATLSGADDASTVGDDAGTVTSTSVLVIPEPSAPPVAVIVPITATPADGALLTSSELSELTDADGALTAVLEGVTGTSAVLAIDPAVVAAIRVLGSSAPATAAEWLTKLDDLPNERFSLQFGDADAAPQAQAQLTALLQPTALTPFLDPGNFTAPAVATPPASPAPSPSATPSDGPVLPDDAALTAIDGAVPGMLWTEAALTSADLAAFTGYLGDGTTTILPSTSLSGEVGSRATVDGSSVLVTHAASSKALSRAASLDDPAAREQQLAEANAQLLLAGQASAAAPLLVGLDRDETRSAAALKEAITSVDTVGFGLTGLLAAPPADATLTSDAEGSRGASLQRMLADEVVLSQFATILDDPQLLLSPKRMQILRAIGVGLSDSQFDTAIEAVHTETDATIGAVDVPPSSTIQLLSANADLPFSVRNDLPWPVSVVLSVHPSDPRLDVQSVTPATIPAGTTTRVKVPVSARVGSGEVSLRLDLSSPTGVPLGQSETVRVSVRAEWETIGLVGFGTLIALLLGLGIIRTIRRKRQEAEPEADAEAAPATDAESAEEPHE